eukprot:2404062-Prymnesium_polylepis.2
MSMRPWKAKLHLRQDPALAKVVTPRLLRASSWVAASAQWRAWQWRAWRQRAWPASPTAHRSARTGKCASNPIWSCHT